jgi:hypothetical protein
MEPFTHCPVAPQVCGVGPLHWDGDTPGVHLAPHKPAVTGPLLHWPALLQVCGVYELHVVALGSRQVVPSQHEPSHDRPPLHEGAHACVAVLHAEPARQSPATPQPHEPFDSHTAPADEPAQTAQVPRFVPQTALAVP